jgi:glycosyltransferase involved in cell wall biosynthesis
MSLEAGKGVMESTTEFYSNFKLSIVIPAYNEQATIRETIDSVVDSLYNKEIIIFLFG